MCERTTNTPLALQRRWRKVLIGQSLNCEELTGSLGTRANDDIFAVTDQLLCGDIAQAAIGAGDEDPRAGRHGTRAVSACVVAGDQWVKPAGT